MDIIWAYGFASARGRCLAVSPNFEIAKNNMAIALTDLGTKVILIHNSVVITIRAFSFFLFLYYFFKSKGYKTTEVFAYPCFHFLYFMVLLILV